MGKKRLPMVSQHGEAKNNGPKMYPSVVEQLKLEAAARGCYTELLVHEIVTEWLEKNARVETPVVHVPSNAIVVRGVKPQEGCVAET